MSNTLVAGGVGVGSDGCPWLERGRRSTSRANATGGTTSDHNRTNETAYQKTLRIGLDWQNQREYCSPTLADRQPNTARLMVDRSSRLRSMTGLAGGRYSLARLRIERYNMTAPRHKRCLASLKIQRCRLPCCFPMNWDELEARIISCRLCPRLVQWREETARVKRRAYRNEEYWGKPVPGWGDQNARVLIVGLAPAAHGGNRTGRVFTGDSSGDFLYAAVYRAGFANQPISRRQDDGLVLTDVYIAAAARCAPPDNKPTREELAACLPYLVQEIALLKRLQVIVALGRIGFEAVLRVYEGWPGCYRRSLLLPQFAHAAVIPLGEGLPTVVTSYHPSRQNTQTGRLTAEMFDLVWQRARNLLDTL